MRWILGLIVVVVAGCSNKLGGDLTIDGTAVTLESCRSGQIYGFAGVELVTTTGAKLRLVGNPDSTANALVAIGGPTFADLGKCGPIQNEPQSSTINNVRNVKGTAKLDCEAGGHKIKGSISWENCH
ncbi:MAG: hypothetical protein AB7O24_21140 [Kofleriaceae bacterium]